jgi:hypothetical protein
MASNVDVKITADVADLTAKFALAKQQSLELTKELNQLAKDAAASGGDLSGPLSEGLRNAGAKAAQAKAEMTSLGNELKKTQEHGKGFGDSLNVLRGGLAALGIDASIQGLKAFGEAVEENAAHLQHEADVLQLNVIAYQAFRQAAIESGVNVDDADGAIRRFSKNAGEAAVGSGNAGKAFLEMGININQSKAALLQQVAAYELHASASERDRFATELFGRSGAEMIPLFKEWAKGSEELGKKFDSMGRIINPQTTEAAEQANIKLKGVWEEMKVSATPTIVNMTQALVGLVEIIHAVGTGLSYIQDPLKIFGHGFESFKKPPKPEQQEAPPKITEKDEIAQLQALDPKMRERNDLQLRLNGLLKEKKDFEKEGHGQAAAAAQTAIDDVQKQLDAINKPEKKEFGGGYSNAGDKQITETREKNETLKAENNLTAQQIYEQEQANWQKLLDGHKLNAKQIEDVKKEMARETIAINKQTAQELEEEQKSDLQMNVTLARLALQETRTNLETEFAQHKISAQAKYDATIEAINKEVNAQKAAQQEIIESANTTVVQKHEAMDQEVVLDAQKNAAIAAAAKTLTQELKTETDKQMEQYRDLVSGINSLEGGLVNSILTKRQSLTLSLEQEGLKLLSSEISTSLKYLTERAEVNAGILASDKATTDKGILLRILGLGRETAATATAATAQTAAVAAGEASKTAVKATAATAGKALSAATASTEISQDAAQAGAGAYKAVVGIPIIGPILAPIAAGVAFAAVEAFGSFDKGVNVVPHDMVAQIHAGERIMPAADNRDLIGALSGGGKGGGAGGGDVHLAYAPVIHNSAPKSLGKMLDEQAGDFYSFFKAAKRDGYLD